MPLTTLFLFTVFATLIPASLLIYTSHKATDDRRLIHNIQFSRSVSKIKLLLDPYPAAYKKWLRWNFLCDFLFVICYTAVFTLATRWLLRYFRAGEHFHSLPFVWLLPAVCDVIENIFLLNFLAGVYNRKLFPLFTTAVRIKWCLMYAGFAAAMMTLLLIVF